MPNLTDSETVSQSTPELGLGLPLTFSSWYLSRSTSFTYRRSCAPTPPSDSASPTTALLWAEAPALLMLRVSPL